MIPFSCAASSASAICVARASASSTGIGPSCDAPIQALAVHEFQHEKLLTVGFVQPVDRADVRMIERGQDLRFTTEAGDALGIVGEGVGKELQSDVAPELRVFARYTSPIPPLPSSDRISYGPSRVPALIDWLPLHTTRRRSPIHDDGNWHRAFVVVAPRRTGYEKSLAVGGHRVAHTESHVVQFVRQFETRTSGTNPKRVGTRLHRRGDQVRTRSRFHEEQLSTVPAPHRLLAARRRHLPFSSERWIRLD